ncbi:Proteasome subunit [Dirofilaria immitis]
MAAGASECVSIESTYVYFGTLKLRAVKPTVVHINHIIINVYDVNNAQRLSIQIASKHICKALLCQSGQHKAIAFLVNRFCAGKIRETLHIAAMPEATIGKSAPYFDSESARICQRYILVDIARCTKEDMDLLKRVLCLVEETRLLFKAQSIAQGVVINAAAGSFFGDMDENDFVTLMRDIGLNVKQVSGNVSNLASRLIDRNASSVTPTATLSQSSQIFLHNQSHLYTGNRRPLSAVRSQEIIKSPDVQQFRNISHHQSNPPCTVQQRPITVNIIRVVPPRYCPSLGSSSSMHVSDKPVVTQTVTSPRSSRIINRSPTKKVSILTHMGMQTRTVKQQLNTSELSLSTTSNEPSTSRCGIPSELKISNQNYKRIVHVIDDDDDEGGPLKLAKEPKLDLLLNYPRDQPTISVHYADVEYLRPNEMLNDTIIEFYLKYIQMELISSERRPSIFIFNPFFYSRLTQIPPTGSGVIRTISSRAKWIAENYKGVRTWTKNVDIFSADYVVVPIVEDIHWYLAIITYPRYSIVNRTEIANGKENDIEKVMPKRLRKTRIILLDSLADATDMKRKLTVPVLREYLVCEYEDKRKLKDGDTKYFAKELIEKIVPFPVPQQRNYTDCGLFLLKFAECFLLKPPSFITRNDSFRRWYPNFTIRGMRRTILTKLKSACDEEAWRAYEEYSRNRDVNNQSVEDILPKQSAHSRSPSPTLRRRTLSTGDCDVSCNGHFGHEENRIGGTILAMVGNDCVCIASDLRLGEQMTTIATNMKKVYKLGEKVYIGLGGFHSDAKTVLDKIAFRKNLYELRENRKIKPEVVAVMVSNLLYQHRFGGYFTEPLIAGLDPTTNKPYICSMDTIGCISAPNDFVAVGTGTEYLLGVCEGFWKEGMNSDELFEATAQSMLSAMERDAASGWGVIVYTITKDKVNIKTIKARMD